ncbi:hypothetical protein GQ53DRAFT_657753, partial [Thozetella sp. PMI_491]
MPFSGIRRSNSAKLYGGIDISKGQIRVLSLYPGKVEDPLLCKILTTELSSPCHEQYEALSYCWGDTSKVKTIGVQIGSMGAETILDLPINASLYEALLHIRPAIGPPRNLWADAICINQNDRDERSQQVAQMHLTYRQASRVIIWLGPLNKIRQECFASIMAIQS